MPKALRVVTTVQPSGKVRLQAAGLGELWEDIELDHCLMAGRRSTTSSEDRLRR